MLYRRFTEKSAEEWRQIYKSLQLLEFLIKNGSERVIDDARGHITLLKMLRQFHFIDPNGKDQGINVRNRAKELAELLSDVDRIRVERKKARATKNKYTGVEGGASLGGGFSGGSRFGGFGSESTNYGGYSGGVYGDGGGYGGQASDNQESGGRSDRFEEYDEFDEEERPSRSSRKSERTGVKKTTAAEPPKKKEPEVDLFSFDDPEQGPSSAAPTASAPSNGSGLAALGATSGGANNDDDDFDDFQSASPAATAGPSSAFVQPLSPPLKSTAATAQFAAPQPLSAPRQADINQFVSKSSISPPPTSNTGISGANYSSMGATATMAPQQTKPAGYQPSGPNYFGTVQATSGNMSGSGMSGMPGMSSNTPTTMANAKPVMAGGAKPATGAAGGDAFGALWGKASAGIKKTDTPTSGPAMGQLAKEKSSAGIWGAPATASSQPPAPPMGGGSASDDLLG